MGGPGATEHLGVVPPGRRRVAAAWATPDRRCVLALLVLPVLVFVGPALFGYPAITGDNAIQNFPLRVFSGELLRHGHLPLWNPYIWSGNPLLGGLNAGSLYPFTLLFSVLPATAAWVLNLLGAYWAGGLGLYALARQCKLAPLAALLAALTYAFGGAMVGQLVHLPIVQGMGWIPFMVLAQVRLAWAVFGTGPPPRDEADPAAPAAGEPARAAPAPAATGGSPWPWVTLLAASIGAILLTGEPRGMAEAELVATPMALWLTLRRYPGVTVRLRRRAAYLGLSLFGAAWAVALGAVQLVPGWAFITASQRSSETFSFVGAGSLHPNWSVLLLVPDLFGGNGVGSQPAYFNGYNLPEVTGYVGLLPLVALLVLLGRSLGRRRDRRALEYAPWIFLVVFGAFLSFGEFTPLGHALSDIPFYSQVRLPSRSLGIVDLALAVLFGYWADSLLAGRAAPATRAPARPARRRLARAGLLAVPAAALTLCVVAYVAPVPLQNAFTQYGGSTSLAQALRPWLVLQAVVAVLAGALVVAWWRLGPAWRRVSLVAVVVCDLVAFNVSSATGYATLHRPVSPSRAAVTAVMGTRGRFAIFDTTATQLPQLVALGQPDLNALVRAPSVQGYGSLVGSTYGTATFSHALDTLSACALAEGVFAPLRLSTLLVPSVFVAPPIGPDGKARAEYGSPPPPCPGAPLPGTPGRRTFYLGEVLELRSVTLGRAPRSAGPRPPAAAGPLRVGVIGPSGATAFPAERIVRNRHNWVVVFARPVRTQGVVVTGPARRVTDASTVTADGGAVYSLDGELQDGLDQTGWRPAGYVEGYARFVHPSLRPPVWVVGPAGAASVQQLATTAWGTETDSVTAAHPVVVVRSEAYLAGWHAVAVPAHGTALDLPVFRDGLVQAVRVPAGRWTLTFLYRPADFTVAVAGTGLGLAGLVAAAVVAVRRRRIRGPAAGVR